MNTDRPIQTERTGVLQRGAGPVSSLVARRSLASFTLIELLVVVAVILILFSISMKMMGIVGRKAATTKTLYVLEQTRNALDSYFTVMGSYPNTTEIRYDHCVGQSPSGFDASAEIKKFEKLGLVYYIGYEVNDRADSWQKFATTVINEVGSHTNLPVTKAGFDPVYSSNKVESIQDGWGSDVVYIPNPNSDGYILFSSGPDKNPTTTDDNIGIDKNE